MKKFLIVAAVAALPAAGCIQTLPDGSIAAAPGTASLLSPNADSFGGPPPQHLVREGGRVIAADPDVNIRNALQRDRCSAFGTEPGTCQGD